MNIEEIKTQLAVLTAAVEALNDPHAGLKAAYKADPTIKLQCRLRGSGHPWCDLNHQPNWEASTEYRIKPAPDAVQYQNTYNDQGFINTLDMAKQYAGVSATGVIKITHDGEGKLKSVEVVA